MRRKTEQKKGRRRWWMMKWNESPVHVRRLNHHMI